MKRGWSEFRLKGFFFKLRKYIWQIVIGFFLWKAWFLFFDILILSLYPLIFFASYSKIVKSGNFLLSFNLFIFLQKLSFSTSFLFWNYLLWIIWWFNVKFPKGQTCDIWFDHKVLTHGWTHRENYCLGLNISTMWISCTSPALLLFV